MRPGRGVHTHLILAVAATAYLREEEMAKLELHLQLAATNMTHTPQHVHTQHDITFFTFITSVKREEQAQHGILQLLPYPVQCQI